MKKVFHFVTNPTVNGLEKLVMTICQTVEGFDYTYVVPQGPIEKQLDKLDIKYIPLKKMNSLSVRRVIIDYKPDIVHGHDVKASLYLAFNYKLCKKNGIKVISELHNDDQRMHKLTIRSLIYDYSTKFYDSIVCVSQDVYDNYKYKNHISGKVKIIDNIVNPMDLNCLEDNIEDIDCIFVGRFEYQKNPSRFVEIIKHVKEYLPNIKCTMIGEGSLKSDVLKFINDLMLENNINVMDYQSNPYKFINKSKVLYMPSRYEGFGLVALESMLIGTPVVCHKVTGLDRIVKDDTGLITNNDSQIISEIVRLIKDKNYYESKSSNAILRAKKINNINLFREKYSDLYNS